MKKIAIFWEKRFDDNGFRNLDIDQNLSPFLALSEENGMDNTISCDLLSSKDKESIILCFLTLSIFTILKYIYLLVKHRKNIKYFFIFEPRIIAPLNYIKLFHVFFDRIYTRNDDLVDNKKYFKFIWPQSKHSVLKLKKFEEKGLMCCINSRHYSFIKNELYTEREKAIRYFESHSIDFDLYGRNWDSISICESFFGKKKYLSYKGSVADKIKTLSKYKFILCFENMKNTPGYITEKIRDSFKAKSVPVYRGASNIERYIPSNCFIDFRKFNGYKELLEYLDSIDDKMYYEYIHNIEKFLSSDEARKRFDSHWAKDFINTL